VFDYFKNLTTEQSIYFYVALFFSVIFILQTVFTFLDLGDSIDIDADFDSEVDISLGDSIGLPFQLFTIRGIIGFFLVFGWSGFLLSKNNVHPILTFILAFVFGAITLVLVALIYSLALKLETDGTTKLKNAIGKEAEVYLPIPANNTGYGKIHVVISGALREVDAITYGEALTTGEVVRVVQVLNDKVVVEKIKNSEGEK